MEQCFELLHLHSLVSTSNMAENLKFPLDELVVEEGGCLVALGRYESCHHTSAQHAFGEVLGIVPAF